MPDRVELDDSVDDSAEAWRTSRDITFAGRSSVRHGDLAKAPRRRSADGRSITFPPNGGILGACQWRPLLDRTAEAFLPLVAL